MNFKFKTLASGLRTIIVAIPNLESVTVTVWVGTGSRYEEAKISGISHFLEHMVFKGSKKRPTNLEIAREIDAIGAEFNAGTSKEWTQFYIKSAKGQIKKAFDVLSDMVLHPILRAQDIEKEKGVIVEEIKFYEDTPTEKIGDIFEELIFQGNPLSRDIAGTVDSVSAISKSDFENFRNNHYRGANILITVCGAVDTEEAEGLINEYFSDVEKGTKLSFDIFKNSQTKPRVFLKTKPVEQAHLILGFHAYPMDHPNRFAASVLATILGRGMSSRLWDEVKEKRGLSYALRTSVDKNADCGYFATYAGVDVKRIDEAIAVILKEHYGISSSKMPISNDELKKAKEYIKGHLALSLEDTRDISAFFGVREIVLGKIESPEEIYAGIDKVEISDVVGVAEDIFVPHKLNLAIIGPYKDRAKFEKLLL